MKILHFTADWCGPCKMMTPKIEAFKTEMGDRVDVQSINVDDNTELTSKYTITNIPTFLFLNENEDVHAHLIGAQPITKFQEIVSEYESQN